MIRFVIRVDGVVQGVGFRPFVYALAERGGLTGFVRNEGDWVRIEVEGDPGVAVLDAGGRPVAAPDPLAYAVAALRDRRIVAVKGLGGFHLACDARRADAVAELRRRKHRDEKPLAVMVADLAAAEALGEVAPAEAERLRSPERPIVLLRRRGGAAVAD